jgi:hypothetical protein
MANGIFQLGSGQLQTQTGKVRGIGRRTQHIQKNRAGRQLRRLRSVQAIRLRGKGVNDEQVPDGCSRNACNLGGHSTTDRAARPNDNSATTYGNLNAQSGVVRPHREEISPFDGTRVETGVRRRRSR